MRRTNHFAAAAVGAVFTVLAIAALPGVGIGSPTTSHGGMPSDVFTTTEPEVCAVVGPGGASAMSTHVTVGATSNLLVSFSSERSGLDSLNTELLLSFFVLDDEGEFVVETPFEWGLGTNPRTHESGTVMWSFDAFQPGTYDISVGARVDPVPGPRGGSDPTAVLENCALSVTVIPVA